MRTLFVAAVLVGLCVAGSRNPYEERLKARRGFKGLTSVVDRFQHLNEKANSPALKSIKKQAAARSAAALEEMHRHFSAQQTNTAASESESVSESSSSVSASSYSLSASSYSASSSSWEFGSEKSPFSFAPECSDPESAFSIAYSRAEDVCDSVNVSALLTTQFQSIDGANRAFGAFCSSPCLGSMLGLYNVKGASKCFSEEEHRGIGGFLAMCEMDESGQNFCGAILTTSDALDDDACLRASQNRTQCESTPGCAYDGESCSPRLTNRGVQEVCGSCLRTFTTVSGFGSIYNSLCRSVDGEYCSVALQDLPHGGDLWFQNTTYLNEFCTGSRQQCKVMEDQETFAAVNSYATDLTEHCLETVEKYSQWWYRSDAERAEAESMCFVTYVGLLFEFHLDLEASLHACARRGTRLCADFLEDPAIAAGQQCLQTVLTSGACSAACDTAISSLVTTVGCCFVDIVAPLSVPELTAEAFPLTLRDRAQPLIPNITAYLASALSGMFPDWSILEKCETASQRIASTRSCLPEGGRSSLLTFGLNIDFDLVERNYSSLLLTALTHDLAHSAALEDSAIVNISVIEDSKVGGARVTFQVRAEIAIETTTAARVLADQIELGALHLDLTAYSLFEACGLDCFSDWPLIYDDEEFVIPSAPVDACLTDAYFAIAAEFEASCDARTTRVFTENPSNLSDANSAWRDLCTSDCFSNALALRTSRYGDCLDQETVDAIISTAVSCTKDSAENYCGAILGQLDNVQCDNKTEAACGRLEGCDWIASSRRCVASPSQSFLETVCGGGCVSRMVGALAATASPLAVEALYLQQVFCAREGDGQFCIPLVKEEMLTIQEEGFVLSATRGLCENDAKGRCFRRMWSGVSELNRRAVEEEFVQCAAHMFDTYSAMEAEYNIATICLMEFLGGLLETERLSKQVTELCTRNSDGEYCNAFLTKYEDNECLDEVLFCRSYDWFYGCDCPTECYEELKNITVDMGCCLGTVQSIYGTPSLQDLDPADIPSWDALAPEEAFDDSYVDFSASDSVSASSESASASSESVSGSSESASASSESASASSESASSESASASSESASASSKSGSSSSESSASSKSESSVSGSSESLSGSSISDSFFDFSGSDFVPVPEEPVQFVFDGLFANLAYCTGEPTLAGISRELGSACRRIKFGEPRTFVMPLGISFETLQSDPELIKRMGAKMTNDLGNFDGVAPEDHASNFTADNSTRIVVPTSNRRHMSTMATTSATRVNVAISTQNPRDARASSAQLNAAQANRTLVLPSTTRSVANECKNCTGPGGAASLQRGADLSAVPTPPSARPTTTSTTSGSAAMSCMTAVVAALSVIAMLF